MDRLLALEQSTTLNGIDFVEIASFDQRTLRVHFLNAVSVEATVTGALIAGGETVRTVPLKPIDNATDWSTDADGRDLLTLHVASPGPGDFSFYTLTLVSAVLDAFFSSVKFSFKALCPSDLDCAPAPVVRPPLAGDKPPIDYLAKDFLSFRKALSDFSALRYPEWQERSEADFGVMFMEALCSLADDLSYMQDRVAAEGTLATATQRRSIVRHARLVDYEPRPATAAQVILQFDVQSGTIPTGLRVSAQSPDGPSIDFETGTGLIDPATGLLNTTAYAVNPAWNRGILPYFFDDSQSCLKAGSTEMYVAGHGFGFQPATASTPGQALLIDTQGQTTADPHIREIVHLISVDEETDLLFNQAVTHLVWSADEALHFDHDLTLNADGTPRTVLAGNLVPATQGRRYIESFAIDQAPAGARIPLAIFRDGPNSAPDSPFPQYLYTLANAPLAWLVQSPGAPPLPEIVLTEQPQEPASPPILWRWRRRLLEAQEFEKAFTVAPVRFIATARNSDGSSSFDYDGDAGDTIHFGDDVFGEIPEGGSVFQITYRAGGGAAGNVAADSIVKIDPAAAGLFLTVTNPFAATGGEGEEPDETVRRLAPQAFRAQRLFDVRPEDYEATAKTLPWVLQAGTVFRWTGSWLTVFTTADPKGTESETVEERTELIDLLNRFRLAGYESYVPEPVFVSIDLIVEVCARSDAFRGDVEGAVLAALSASKFPDGTTGFFFVDRFTFGTPLERSALEAAIQAAYGVAGVISIQYRQRGATAGYLDLPDTLPVAANRILRMDNDPSNPERGSLHVIVDGGK
jgi:hypothetical protein